MGEFDRKEQQNVLFVPHSWGQLRKERDVCEGDEGRSKEHNYFIVLAGVLLVGCFRRCNQS